MTLQTLKKTFQKIPKWLRITTGVLIVIIVIAYFGIGWYFSGMLLKVKPQQIDYDQTVTAVSQGNYTIKGSAYDVDGVMGYIRSDGSFGGTFTAPKNLNKSAQTSTRSFESLTGAAPKVGDKISVQGNIWTTDPKQALGLTFENVKYQSPVGAMDAWFVPAAQPSNTWTIEVHGIGGQKREMLRFTPAVHSAGDNVMVINYRGDTGEPASPDGFTHLGDTEWQDVQAAVRYAKSHGATNIRMYGSSLGGSLVENYLHRSSDVATSNITKVILDSPALDWNEILKYRVTDLGYPAFIAGPGKTVASLRSGINFNRISTKPGTLKQPTLLFHNADDKSVPQAASKRMTAAQPNLVTFEDFGTGGHIRAWNHNPTKYEAIVEEFLKN